MSHAALRVAFLFDAGYLEPALISAASFFRYAPVEHHSVAMVYLAQDTAHDEKVRGILARFAQGISNEHPGATLELVELRARVFDGYVQQHHFSKAILYKAIVPQAFPHWGRILLLDCGMIFGRHLPRFLAGLARHATSPQPPAVAAYCVDSQDPAGLLPALRDRRHHALYPAGGTLYFDVERYRQADIYSRLIANFHAERSLLVYAEQELFCLTLQDDELQALSDQHHRCHIDLADPKGWQSASLQDALYVSGEHLYIKHVGSFKPWKKWVLHPSKSIYLRERRQLVPLIGEEALESLRDDQIVPAQPAFLLQQLSLLEAHYERHDRSQHAG